MKLNAQGWPIAGYRFVCFRCGLTFDYPLPVVDPPLAPNGSCKACGSFRLAIYNEHGKAT